MDITQALKDTENSLRDFIAATLNKELGEQWVEKCGVSEDRLAKWRERKEAEERRQESGVVEERLLYYADFYDLKTILKKHWSGEFSKALGDWKTMDVWLNELEKLRDPDAHRRELLPHQKHLVLGIAGEIRTRLVRYRSKQETSEDYYPRIESVRDSLGNIYVPGSAVVRTGTKLRPRDVVEFVVTATDPQGASLQYCFYSGEMKWQDSNTLTLVVSEKNIGVRFDVLICIRSPRKFHAYREGDDDRVLFVYEVLPPKI